MDIEVPITWLENRNSKVSKKYLSLEKILPDGLPRRVAAFHRQIPGYRRSPLKGLSNLAGRLGIGGIWVKDESVRLDLSSFKVLGGSYAIYQLLKQRLGLMDQELSYETLTSPQMRARIGDLTFAAATDGNHGRGVAWSATQLGCKSVIYVHKLTSKERIQSIENNGAKVVVIDGNYDDAVRQISMDAEKNGWIVISDTSWPGYEDV
ncbi:MAG TPA: pyridoxal-phosphate dependent enzyme, partial [Bacteroidales bacterium]|nr:pyridoxal-phosphate dependent enzyme [Bacteroidales bacterium]